MRRFFALEADRAHETPRERVDGSVEHIAGTISAGRFGLIGLEELREAVGPRWPELEGRVRALAEAVITRHLTQGDVFEIQDDGSYVVLFAQLNEEAALFKCRVMGREITERLLSSESPRLADVESVSAQVRREALSSGDLEVVFTRAFAAGQATISSDPSSPRSPTATVPPLRAADHGPAHPDAGHRLLQQNHDDLGAAEFSGGGLVAGHRDRSHLIEPVWRYTPVWDFKSMSLVRFRLTAGRNSTAAEDPRAVAAHDGGAFEVDVGTVSKALNDLQKLHDQGRRLLIICVVHQSSLAVQWRRDQLVDLVRAAPSSVRRLLWLEIASTEFNPTLALGQFVRAVDTLGVACSACVPLSSPTAIRPAGMPLKTAAVEATGGSAEAEALPLLNTFSRRAAQVGLGSAAHRLDSRSLVIGAVAAGIRFLSGAAIRPDLEDLAQGLRFEPSDLYRDLLLGAPEQSL